MERMILVRQGPEAEPQVIKVSCIVEAIDVPTGRKVVFDRWLAYVAVGNSANSTSCRHVLGHDGSHLNAAMSPKVYLRELPAHIMEKFEKLKPTWELAMCNAINQHWNTGPDALQNVATQ